MNQEKYLLVFDAGTGSGRCLLFDYQGKSLAKAVCAWKYSVEPGGRLTFDPQDWWEKLAGLCRKVLSGFDPSQIAAVTATSQRHGLVAFNRDGQEAFGWPNLDRTVSQRLDEKVAEEVYQLAGRWPGPIHAGWRLAAAPEVAGFLPISDWLLFRLTGVKSTEPTQAAETCLLDIHSGQWSADAASLFGLDGLELPELKRPGTVLGTVTCEAAQQTGLLSGTPVAIAGADTQCGSLGCGAGFTGRLGLIAGTSAPLTLTLDRPVLDDRQRTITNPGLLPGSWLLESNALFTGSSYAKLRDLLLPGWSYEKIDRDLATIRAWTEVPVYLGASIMNSRQGSLLPWGGLFTRVPMTELSPQLLLRAALESAACAIRANLEQLGEIAGEFFNEHAPIYLGGGASGGLWAQLVADVCRRPVVVAAEREVSSLGAAMCAATATGYYATLPAAAQAMAHPARTLYPQPVPQIEKIYNRWLAGYYGLGVLSQHLA